MLRLHVRLRDVLGIVLAAGCHVYDDGLLSARVTPPEDAARALDASAGVDAPRDADLVGERDRPSRDAGSAGSGGTPGDTMRGSNATDPLAADSGSEDSAAGDATTAIDDDDAGVPPNPAPCTEAGGSVWPDNGHCYFALRLPTTWFMSRDQCMSLGAHLAVLTSEREQAFVATLVTEAPRWLGLARFGAPAFSWVNGEAVSYENWERDAPSRRTEAGVALHHETHKWFDDSVNQAYGPLCEREP